MRSSTPPRGNNPPTSVPVSFDDDTARLSPVLTLILGELKEIRERLAGTHKPWLTIEEVARLTGRTEYTVRRWVKEGRIHAIRVNGTGPRGRLLVTQDQIQRLVALGMGGEVPSDVSR